MTASAPLGPRDLTTFLDELNIAHRTISHPPVYTVEEARRLRGSLPGGNCKSLFLKNKKGQMWLVVVPEDQKVDLAVLAGALGSRRLSFASPERLMARLGVIPGAVTPFAVINDPENVVSVALDARLLSEDQLNFHPLVNDQTTTVATDDFLRFLEATGHPPILLDSHDL